MIFKDGNCVRQNIEYIWIETEIRVLKLQISNGSVSNQMRTNQKTSTQILWFHRSGTYETEHRSLTKLNNKWEILTKSHVAFNIFLPTLCAYFKSQFLIHLFIYLSIWIYHFDLLMKENTYPLDPSQIYFGSHSKSSLEINTHHRFSKAIFLYLNFSK